MKGGGYPAPAREQGAMNKGGGYPASAREQGTPGAAASRLLHRKIEELLSSAGGRDSARARSMALDLVEQVDFLGVLKSVNVVTGCGFVECPETFALFSRDLPVAAPKCEGVPVGARLGFRVRMVRGQPSVCSISPPPDAVDGKGMAARDGEELEHLSGMAAVLAQTDRHSAPTWNEAALTWKEAKERDPHAGMGSLLAHEEGPGRSANEWRPSTEADDRYGMAAVRAHRLNPQTYPMPQVRQGKFVGWTSN